jgi:hypothetical protein
VTGRWRCRQLDVLAALDRELDEAYGHLFASLDLVALLADRDALLELLAPFVSEAAA